MNTTTPKKNITPEQEMGTKKMLPLILAMALPPMISMLIQSLYNIVDSIFVARLSADALAAVSIIFPLQNLTLSISVGTGVGLNSYIARSLGAGNKKRADAACRIGFLLTGLHYLILAPILMLSMPWFVRLFTDSDSIQRSCLSYGYIVIFFCFGQLFHITIEKIFQATGQMKIPMLLQGVGCIINIILDPLFIFGYLGFPKWGVAGAAVATIIGQLTACALGVFLFFRQTSGVRPVKTDSDTSNKEIVRQIYGVAIPSTLVMAFPSILVSCLNGILSSFSAMAVSVFGIYYKLQTFVYMPSSGLVQGIRPIIAFNYGAGNKEREKEAIRISLYIVGGIMAVGTLMFLLFPRPILAIFGAEEAMASMAVPALRIICIGFLPSAASVVGSAVFESIGKGGKSLLITLLRQLLILIPLACLLSIPMGLAGIWTAFPVAEIAACIVTFFLLKKKLHHDSNTLPT